VIAACFTRADDDASGDKIFGQVQAALKQALPYYMVPSLYFVFERFPALPSGKTDKKAILARVERCIREGEAGATRFAVAGEAVPA
jgi:hypothetical protein